MNLFFSESQQKKLDLFHYLLFNNYSTSVQVFTERWDLSPKSISRYVSSINEDCQSLSTPPLCQIETKGATLSLVFPESTIPSYTFERLTAFYARTSDKVKIIDALLAEQHPNVATLADSLYLTSSSAYAHLYQLENVLKPFDLSFTWEKKKRGLNFTYEEKKIRYFSYLFYWTLFKGTLPAAQDSILESLSELEVRISSDFPELIFIEKKRQLAYLTHISLWHMVQHAPVHLTNTGTQLLRLIVGVKDYSDILSHPTFVPSESETLFFNFLVRISISSIDSFKLRASIVQAVSQQNSKVAQYCHDLYQQLIREFDSDPTERDIVHFYYNILILTLYNFEIGVPFENEFMADFDMTFYQKESQLRPDALQTIDTIFTSVTHAHNMPVKNEQMAHSVIWLFLTSPRKHKVATLAINFSNSPMGAMIIKNRLLQLFNPALLQFTDQVLQADLVISDCSYLKESSQGFFYMDRLVDQDCWDRLFEVIQKQLAQLVL